MRGTGAIKALLTPAITRALIAPEGEPVRRSRCASRGRRRNLEARASLTVPRFVLMLLRMSGAVLAR